MIESYLNRAVIEEVVKAFFLSVNLIVEEIIGYSPWKFLISFFHQNFKRFNFAFVSKFSFIFFLLYPSVSISTVS